MPNKNVAISGGGFLCMYFLLSEESCTRKEDLNFEYLLTLIAPKISRNETSMRPTTTQEDGLAVTPQFLASAIRTLSEYRSSQSLVLKICEPVIAD